MAQSVLSVRNQPKIADNGYAYSFDKCSKDGTLRFYRCDKRYDNCSARIDVPAETGENVGCRHDHNHGSDAARIEAAKSVNDGIAEALPSEVPKRKKYREAVERILTIVTEYRNREIIEYLRGIAHNYQME